MKFYRIIFTSILIFSCEDKVEKDTTPPTVTITTPAVGSTLNEVVTVTCMSKDNKGVQMVELWIDGESTSLTDETEPYAFELNTTTYKDGEHTLIVRSYDVSDNQADSAPITVIIDNTISAPSSIAISKAEFSNGGFTINWTRSTDGDFKSYTVEHSVESQMNDYEAIFTTDDIATTTARMEDTSPLYFHYFRVAVKDTFGYESKGEIYSTSLDPIPESVDVQAVAYDLNTMTVEWQKSKETDFKSYTLLYSVTENGSKDTIDVYKDINSTSFSTNNFDPTRENWYWVMVSDTLGQSNLGNGKSNTIDSTPSPSNILLVSYDLEALTVAWEISKAPDFLSYRLLFSDTENGVKDTIQTYNDISVSSFSTVNFDPTKENWFWIEVSDKWGLKSVGVGKSNTIDSFPQKVDINVTYNPGEYYIDWNESLDDDFNQYDLYVAFNENMLEKSKIFSSQNVSDTFYHLIGLGDIQKRFFQLQVTDFFGQSTYSEVQSADIVYGIQTVNVENFNINYIEKEKRPYYKWGKEPKSENYSKDGDGIILWNGYYHPVLMSTKALNYLTTFQKTNDEWFFKKSLDLADKIIELSDEKNGSYYFPYTWFKIGHNEYFYPNWYSGMAQGRWLSYFSQLYIETKNEKYKRIADKIYSSVSNLHSEPNVTAIDKDNNFWIEEYPNAHPSSYHERGPTHVLNGFVFAIWGLYDYYWIDQDPAVKRILQATITTLYNKAPSYRREGGNSFYCIKHQKHSYAVASDHYHDIHIKQLYELYEITGEDFFKTLSEDFALDSD